MKELNTVFAELESEAPRMKKALDYLWANPQTGYREWKAEAYLEKEWEELGYTLTKAGNIPGFVTDLDTGRPGPKILVMAELDSLLCRDHPDADPETGAVHACGHCAQGVALLGLAAALQKPGALEGLSGSIRLCMVPAEELIEIGYREELREQGIIRYFGGKCEFMYRGLFDGCDMSILVHTGGGRHHFGIAPGSNGCISKKITFLGKAAHAGGSPWNGINALYEANTAFSAVNALRETFREKDYIRFHPIITSGGTVVNAIPSSVTAESYVRGATYDAIRDANRRINRAIAGSAAAFGGNVELCDRPGYMPLVNDKTLTEIFLRAGAQVVPPENVHAGYDWDTGCSDMGDMSMVMPSIHIFGSGADGTGHGNDYVIGDFDCACMESAKLQYLMLRELMKDDAAEAKRVKENAAPFFSSFADYFAAQDSITMDRKAVEYAEDGGITLRYQ